MGEADITEDLKHALVEGWALSDEVRPSMHELLAALAMRVSQLLDKDPNKLSTAMYTLDIDELRFQDAMHLPGMDLKSTAVAELILERELQKIESRRRYEEMKRNTLPES